MLLLYQRETDLFGLTGSITLSPNTITISLRTILKCELMSNYIYDNCLSTYDDDNRLLSQSKIDEIAEELSREVTQEIIKQFDSIFK